MIGYILTGFLLIFAIRRFYKYRAIFKQLSKKEWLQFGAGFLLAWAGAVFIIIGGSSITDMVEITWLNNLLGIVLILIGLALAVIIMSKILPNKIKEFYSGDQ
ncbi:succinate dehydrogenase hydrophobic anchor subunit [Solibacillus kalamii]|uniref:Uncharacterized protein n=1 Tax=Solibacillus kalamii TaxID=1748298 RepID=A0ABX3ZGB2_9BACL|nr:hypothetical protein [Solibacillus kalamii]MBM7665991.1 succinate dehydrogenase hydrophobic anchor subunit [Solibacillus kalamii]OUZ38497.1 hypothetical protein CBM15_12140 [Solibacillus kalamii]